MNIEYSRIVTMDLFFSIRMSLRGSPTFMILNFGYCNTMFLDYLSKLKSSYFVDGASTTKCGLIDSLFLNNPKYLLIDEIDKMSAKDQAMLLNLMELE